MSSADDPYQVIPHSFPDAPRVLANTEDLARTRSRLGKDTWIDKALDHLIARANAISSGQVNPTDPENNFDTLMAIQCGVLAHLLTDEPSFLDRALESFSQLSETYPQLPIIAPNTRATGDSSTELLFTAQIARTCDLLNACPIDETLRQQITDLLNATWPVIDGEADLGCGNHNLSSVHARIAVGSALGNRDAIHDAMYGYKRDGISRYGLIHTLRHDILADGLQFERTAGYHVFVMMLLTDMAYMMKNLGVDLWHKPMPVAMENDGQDMHRDYGPAGDKHLKAIYDALLYRTMPNLDLSLLGDARLANLRGIWRWGTMYETAHDVYGDERYAWLIQEMEQAHPSDGRAIPGLPISLQPFFFSVPKECEFVRLQATSWQNGELDFAKDETISLVGEHRGACTTFHQTGLSILRSEPNIATASGANLHWGPHACGHQSPGALHLDLWGNGRRITDGPRTAGFGDPTHLTWFRTTIAHNTVTVDQKSMYPYDDDPKSIWEADRWHDRNSDGVLKTFETNDEYKVVRASNEQVYPGVCLDRTVVVTQAWVLDLFRVVAEKERTFDWAMHGIGRIEPPTRMEPIDPGDRRGFRHLQNARRSALDDSAINLTWTNRDGMATLAMLPPTNSELIVATDPMPEDSVFVIGEDEPAETRTCAIVRTTALSAMFVGLWQFDPEPKNTATLLKATGTATSDVHIDIESDDQQRRWELPFKSAPVSHTQLQPYHA